MTTTSAPDSAVLAARLQQALALHQQGQLAPARAQYEALLRDHPGQPDALHLLGVLTLQAGDAATAARLIGEAIAAHPGNAEFHLNHAIALRALGQAEAALACYERAVALSPDLPTAHLGRAMLLRGLGRLEESLAAYDRTLALRPDFAEVHFNRGNVLLELQRPEAAVEAFRRAIDLKPALAEAHVNLGKALLQLARATDALAALEQAIALRPELPEAHLLRGNALFVLQRLDDARASYDQALQLKPGLAEALANRGKTLYGLGHDAAALASLDQALALQPAVAETHLFRGHVLCKLFRIEDALAAYEQAIALAPGYAEAWHGKATQLVALKRSEEAIACLQEALRLAPDAPSLPGELLHARMYLCDWTDFEPLRDLVVARVDAGQMALQPFALQTLVDDPALHLRAATLCRTLMQWPEAPAVAPPPATSGKIRVGFFSADFREHPVAHLTAELFENLDRSAFEVMGFGFGKPAAGGMRERLQNTFDRFFDISALSDREAVQLARAQGLDIAIDLGGYTQDSRSGLFALRAAPVQASYIGFLGTMGAPWMDYLVADPVLVPPELRRHYAEKIACLPWYQANDSQRPVAARRFTRAELGLPAQGVVFASFNHQYKITPDVYDCWMRILAGVPHSVLFLLVDQPVAQRHLRESAEARGISGDRIVFGGRLPRAEYLERYRVADLFLDSWPCNAGTTASDSLWMGLPLLTCMGRSFGSRMAASVLQAMSLRELITDSPDAYVRRAIELGTQPGELPNLRRRIEAQRGSAGLFDSARFARNMEAALRTMHERRMAGLPPEHFGIAP